MSHTFFQTAPMDNAEFWPHFPALPQCSAVCGWYYAGGSVTTHLFSVLPGCCRGWWADKGTPSAGGLALPKPGPFVCPESHLAPNGCGVTRQFFLLLFCYYSLLLFIPFTGTTVLQQPHSLHVFVMGFSVRALTFRMNGWAASCLWSKALFITALQ